MEKKIIADAMLGKLAKWLRILGYDTLYQNEISNEELMTRAKAEKRLLLTRDTKLTGLKDLELLFIEGDHWRDQLKQFLSFIGRAEFKVFTRCLLCNRELVEVSKEKIKAKVPPYVYQTQEEFSLCPQCHKIYWAGTHYQRMLAELNDQGA